MVRHDHVGDDVTGHLRICDIKIPHTSTETYKAVPELSNRAAPEAGKATLYWIMLIKAEFMHRSLE